MFTFAIILACVSTIFEMMIASKLKIMRTLAAKYELVNLIISLGLSYVLGVLFGVTGLIAFFAAILSTLFSIPGYKFLAWRYDSETAMMYGGDAMPEKIQNIKNSFKTKFTILKDLMKILMFIAKVITAPLRAYRKVRGFLVQQKGRMAKAFP